MIDDRPPMPEARHIGDGVYVRFDGYQLWLAVNHHTNEVVALDSRVVRNLVEYARQVDAAAGQRYFGV
jgi:hypothetical protein